jgi:Translation elongation factors (GTPases)
MLEEEPSARVDRSDTGEQILVSMGDAHVAVLGERLKRKFGAAIVTKTPRVPYKETIRGKTQAHGRYKKQTGGHGMFGDVWITIEPNPGGGVEFAEHVVGGTVPKNFFPGVEKGIRESAAEGVLAGYPLSDFKATLYDGSFHAVDSNELSFKIAASMALKAGVLECKPALMEPIMTAEIHIPEAYMGDVNRDLTAAADASWAWTPRTGCRSSRPTCPRRSCSPTPLSCARLPAAAAPSAPCWTATRTCRHTSPKR